MSARSGVVPLDERVNLLFATIIDNNGVEVSAATVAQALSASLGRPVAAAEIEALRRFGAKRSRSDLLDGLARYFDMPEGFLSDDPDRYYSSFRQLSLLIVQRDKKIPYVALRSSADYVGDDALQELQNYLESLD
ncbi:hypothetical protein [Nocardia arizonensis]|uniref:hypothetical protein n=1 Tax=Nocardia arizonensis TaxID=1141647 RepID=UPI0012E322DC|nr:hypothetical protein [Nocardia arizonensis]